MFSLVFFFKQKTAYEMRISDWSSDVCSSDLRAGANGGDAGARHVIASLVERHDHRLIECDVTRVEDLQIDLGAARVESGGNDFIGFGGEIGRASCRARVCQYVEISVVAGTLKKKKK